MNNFLFIFLVQFIHIFDDVEHALFMFLEKANNLIKLLKVIDLVEPYARGGKIGLVSGEAIGLAGRGAAPSHRHPRGREETGYRHQGD